MSKKKLKIFAYTATRSEYGLLFWLLKELNNDPEIDFCLIVSGTHLSKKFGYTYDVIKNDKWKKIKCIPSLTKKNNKFDNLISISKGSIGLSEFLTNENPDCIIVLGDRFELFSIMSVCTLLNIPIAHISGGEITEGANDNQIRNAMTKISHLSKDKTSATAMVCFEFEKSAFVLKRFVLLYITFIFFNFIKIFY